MPSRGTKEAKRRAKNKYHHNLRDKIFEHYGRVCACCGTDKRLTIDHLEPREKGGANGWQLYMWIVTQGFPEGFQTLCWPCNRSKNRGKQCMLIHSCNTDRYLTCGKSGAGNTYRIGFDDVHSANDARQIARWIMQYRDETGHWPGLVSAK